MYQAELLVHVDPRPESFPLSEDLAAQLLQGHLSPGRVQPLLNPYLILPVLYPFAGTKETLSHPPPLQ